MAIKILPARLANQIAAGEVVERPASVVKELVENSLDAGATRIDIDIEKGGSKLIRVLDNGYGINKDELTLALSRHATSKITSLDDLEAIMSLGFRGEALASISSVSRLTLTSRTQDQAEAWSAFAEGREMSVTVKPAAHPIGSTVEVVDLFFNTPARRKFLRTEKTEFAHIDELLKRIALSRFDVAITLKHNGAVVRQYRPAVTEVQQIKRLAAICGSQFAKDAVKISLRNEQLCLEGWICTPKGARAQNDIQHCFVNKRIMKDKLINHAIRQGYENTLQAEQFAAYVLYIEISPQQVDVNVHPAKHEVRFHQSRLVHGFIYQTVKDALEQLTEAQVISTPQSAVVAQVAQQHHWQPQQTNSTRHSTPTTSRGSSDSKGNAALPAQKLYKELLSTATPSTGQSTMTMVLNEPAVAGLGKPLAVVCDTYLLLQKNDGLWLLNLNHASYLLMLGKLKPSLNKGLKPQPLLIPQRLAVNAEEMALIERNQPLLQQFGINLQKKNQSQILIMAVCQPLRGVDLQSFFNSLLIFMASNTEPDNMCIENISRWFAIELMLKNDKFSQSQAIGLINELEECWQNELISHYAELFRPVDLTSIVDSFKHD